MEVVKNGESTLIRTTSIAFAENGEKIFMK
jgi:hypothetical protein